MASVQRCAAQNPAVQGSTIAGGISANMALLATWFTPRHRNLGRRRRRVRAEAFAADLATVPLLAGNLEPEPVCVAHWRRIWVAASAAPQQTATCVLQRINTDMCPAKGPVAVGCRRSLHGCPPSPPAAVAAVVLMTPVGAAPTSLARPAGLCSASRLRGPGPCASWLPAWPGCGVGVVLHRAAVSRSILQHTGAGDSPSTTWRQPSATSPE
jgi:hypothetical protein